MAIKARLTTGFFLSRFVSVSVCLCALSFLTPPQLANSTWAESAEEESPRDEEGEQSEEELTVAASERRLNAGRRRSGLNRFDNRVGRFLRSSSYADDLPAIVGHQLANGLRAPLRI